MEAALQAQREKEWPEAYAKGLAKGEELARERLKVTMDWSPVQDLLDRIYTDGVQATQYVDNAEQVVLDAAHAWEHFADSHAWQDVVRSCEGEINRRMSDIVSGKGNVEVHRTMIQFCKALSHLPERTVALAQQVRAAQAPDGKQDQ